jgi:hypothetical protein
VRPLGTSDTTWPVGPVPNVNECGTIDRMRIGDGNLSAWRKPATVSLCPPQIPHWIELGPWRWEAGD